MSALELTDIAESIGAVARALHRLGNADATTPFGAIEGLGAAIIEAGAGIAEALNRIAEAIEARADE